MNKFLLIPTSSYLTAQAVFCRTKCHLQKSVAGHVTTEKIVDKVVAAVVAEGQRQRLSSEVSTNCSPPCADGKTCSENTCQDIAKPTNTASKKLEFESNNVEKKNYLS